MSQQSNAPLRPINRRAGTVNVGLIAGVCAGAVIVVGAAVAALLLIRRKRLSSRPSSITSNGVRGVIWTVPAGSVAQ